MPIDPGPSSRFKRTEAILTPEGFETFGLLSKFRFLTRDNLDDDQIRRLIVSSDREGRVDLLATDIYGDQRLHWILILFNNIENPFGWPKNGQIIEYPDPSIVLPEL